MITIFIIRLGILLFKWILRTVKQLTSFPKNIISFRNGVDFYPEGLRHVLGHVSALYPMTSLYVTDVGLVTENNDVKDAIRVDFIRAYADEVLKGKCVNFRHSNTLLVRQLSVICNKCLTYCNSTFLFVVLTFRFSFCLLKVFLLTIVNSTRCPKISAWLAFHSQVLFDTNLHSVATSFEEVWSCLLMFFFFWMYISGTSTYTNKPACFAYQF